MENIKIGYIGLGCRGKDLLENIVLAQKEQVVAVCDVYEDRAREGAKVVEAAGQPTPFVSTDYKDIIANEEVNTIIIVTAWESHVEIALAAMYAGKAVAMEVGGAYSLEDCYKLVDAYEKTKTPFMFLENCCFGRRELMVLNMVEQGVLGEIVHCAGGYQHDLRDEIAFGKENRHYRLRNYLSRNCENYPTHDLGPIARILNINHGNRMLTLSSFASKSAGLHEFIMQNKSDDERLKQAHFAQGDIITTMIRCANGETIQLTAVTSLSAEPKACTKKPPILSSSTAKKTAITILTGEKSAAEMLIPTPKPTIIRSGKNSSKKASRAATAAWTGWNSNSSSSACAKTARCR